MNTNESDLKELSCQEDMVALNQLVAVGDLMSKVCTQGHFAHRDVLALESIVPGIIMDDYPAGGFTPYASEGNTEQVFHRVNTWLEKEDGTDNPALEGIGKAIGRIVLAVVTAILINTGVIFLYIYLDRLMTRLIQKWFTGGFFKSKPVEPKRAQEEMKKHLGTLQGLKVNMTDKERSDLAKLGTTGKKEVILWAIWNRAKSLDADIKRVYEFTFEAEYSELKGKFKDSDHAFKISRDLYGYKEGMLDIVEDIQHEVFDIVRIKNFKVLPAFMVSDNPTAENNKYTKFLTEFFAILYTDKYHDLLRSIRIADKQIVDEAGVTARIVEFTKSLPKKDDEFFAVQPAPVEEIYENYRKNRKSYIETVMKAEEVIGESLEDLLNSDKMRKVVETLSTLETHMKVSKEIQLTQEWQDALKELNDRILKAYQLAIRISTSIYNHAQSVSTLSVKADTVYGSIKRIRANEKLIAYVKDNFAELVPNIQNAPQDRLVKRIRELSERDSNDDFDVNSLGFAV